MAYLDHAASTPLRPQAREAMLTWMGDRTGNPSGAHAEARRARRAVDDARDVMAEFCGVGPGDIVFTSGGTEADNLAVCGVVDAVGGVAVCAATEHHAVLESVHHLGGRIVPVDENGHLDLDALVDALDADVSVVSVMTANNETGVIADLEPIAELLRRHAPQATFHTDAVQAAPWLDLPERTAAVDALSLSAHKFGGPQGVGVLAVRDRVRLAARSIGGGQERGRRSGTQNVAGIAGMAAAAAAVAAERDALVERTRRLRDRLADGLLDAVDGLVETGGSSASGRAGRIPGTCHLCIPGVEAEAVLVLLDDAGIQASAAASCSSGAQEPSHVLAAMGVPRSLAIGSLRLSLGWSSTDADVDAALVAVPAAVQRLRSHAASPPAAALEGGRPV